MRTVVRMAFHLVAGAPDSAIILCTIIAVLLLIALLDVLLEYPPRAGRDCRPEGPAR